MTKQRDERIAQLQTIEERAQQWAVEIYDDCAGSIDHESLWRILVGFAQFEIKSARKEVNPYRVRWEDHEQRPCGTCGAPKFPSLRCAGCGRGNIAAPFGLSLEQINATRTAERERDAAHALLRRLVEANGEQDYGIVAKARDLLGIPESRLNPDPDSEHYHE